MRFLKNFLPSRRRTTRRVAKKPAPSSTAGGPGKTLKYGRRNGLRRKTGLPTLPCGQGCSARRLRTPVRRAERFKRRAAGRAAPLRAGRTAAAAASSGQGTAEPSEKIEARKREQHNDYGGLHDIFSSVGSFFRHMLSGECPQVFDTTGFRGGGGLRAGEPGSGGTLSRMKIIFKNFFQRFVLRTGTQAERRNGAGEEATWGETGAGEGRKIRLPTLTRPQKSNNMSGSSPRTWGCF